MATATPQKTTKAAWKKAKSHLVTLPSGTEVTIQIPNLPLLVKQGYLPNELVQIALKMVQSGNVTSDAISEQSDFFAKLVKITVKDPVLDEDDIIGEDSIPFEDVEMLVEFATRQRDIDAVGHHLAGLESVKSWQRFRGLDHIYSNVEDS